MGWLASVVDDSLGLNDLDVALRASRCERRTDIAQRASNCHGIRERAPTVSSLRSRLAEDAIVGSGYFRIELEPFPPPGRVSMTVSCGARYRAFPWYDAREIMRDYAFNLGFG